MLQKIKLFFSFCLIISSTIVFGQGHGNSPYSVIGIGEIQTETNASQEMMGGAGVSFANSFYVNALNPALLVKNRTIGFNKYVAFNVGMKGAYKTISQGTKVQNNFGMNLSNLTLVFPVKPRWATGVSLSPYTVADHTTSIKRDFSGSNITNSTEYKSNGGISKVAWTNGIQLAKGLYWGIEGQYRFGNIQKDTTATLSASQEYFRNGARIDLKGYSAKTGMALNTKINKKWNFNAGLAYQLQSTLKGERLGIFSVLAENGNGPLYIQSPDTLSRTNISTETPSNIRAGISFESPYHWVFAVDYSKTMWSGLKQYDANANRLMANGQELSLGLEWLPNYSSSRYLDQVFYRLGYKQGKMPFVIGGVQGTDRAVSFGLSMPMGNRSPSYIDVALAIGRRGVNANGLIQENYTKISVNFSMLNVWFYKPKID